MPVKVERTRMRESAAPAWARWHDPSRPVRVGVSSCLLGEKVRFDGGHKRDRYLTDVLGRWVEWVPTCPEVAVGLEVPRPTLRLEGDPSSPRLVVPSTGADLTRAMERFSRRRARELRSLDLDGYVLKQDSPSCGLERVRVYGASGPPSRRGRGVFARILRDRLPWLPLEEEGRLRDPSLRENFIERIFAHNRWRVFRTGRPGRRRLVEFHTAHKLLLRSHHEAGYRRLGRIVASLGSRLDAETFREYEAVFHETLAHPTTRKQHANVLYHALGYLKEVLEAPDRRDLAGVVEAYRLGRVPLVVPVTLLRFLARRHRVSYLEAQVYLEPHPTELMLRNRV